MHLKESNRIWDTWEMSEGGKGWAKNDVNTLILRKLY